MESDQQSNDDIKPTAPSDELADSDPTPTSEERSDGVADDKTADADVTDAPPSETSADETASEKIDAPRPSVAAIVRDDELPQDLPEISDEPVMPPAATRMHRKGDLEAELSAQTVGAELKRIEAAVRSILENRDPRRKRKLSGSFRWLELEDDIRSWRFSGRLDEASLDRLMELVQQRHFLFRHLRFIGSTRPTWNS